MNQNSPKIFELNFAGISNWLIFLALLWLVGSIGLGWIVKSLLIVVSLVLVTLVVGFFGLRWWLSRNLIIDQCPVCNYEFPALNQTQCQCSNCGEPLKVEAGHFYRLTPPGTIDVTAVEVPAVRQLED